MYHKFVEKGAEYIHVESGDVVRVVMVDQDLTVSLPDTETGHGGTLRVRKGDCVCGKSDGSLFGVPMKLVDKRLKLKVTTSVPRVFLPGVPPGKELRDVDLMHGAERGLSAAEASALRRAMSLDAKPDLDSPAADRKPEDLKE